MAEILDLGDRKEWWCHLPRLEVRWSTVGACHTPAGATYRNIVLGKGQTGEISLKVTSTQSVKSRGLDATQASL